MVTTDNSIITSSTRKEYCVRRASRMLERAARCLRSAVSTSINLRQTSCVAWFDHFTHTIGSEEIVHAVHQRRCAVLSCWGAPTQTIKFIFLTLLTLFSKKNIKFKVALLPCLGLNPRVISVSNHGRRVVKSGTPSSTPCVSAAVTSLVHSKHLTW